MNPNPTDGASALDRGDLLKDAAYYRLTRAEAEDHLSRMRSVCG